MNNNIDTDEIAVLSADVAKEFVEKIKTEVSDEVFKNLSASKMLAFSYTHIFQEMCKDNMLHPTTRAHLLKSVVNNIDLPDDIFGYSHQTQQWKMCGLPIVKENAIINSKNIVERLWEKDVIPSYTIMVDSSTKMLNSVQIQSPGERLKNQREENTVKNTIGVTKSSP